MTRPSPFWQQLQREVTEQLADIDFRIKQQQSVIEGFNEPHMEGLWSENEKKRAYEEYRVIVPRRLAKPLAE